MRIKISEFRKFIREAIETLAQEDVDRLRREKDKYGDDVEESVDRINRNKHGYGDSEFDESVDRVNRNKSGYGDSLFDESLNDLDLEASIASTPATPQSARQKPQDKSQMQGKGAAPTMATAFSEFEPKKEAAIPSDKEEKWVRDNEADFKARYGKAYKDRLYGKAKEKFKK